MSVDGVGRLTGRDAGALVLWLGLGFLRRWGLLCGLLGGVLPCRLLLLLPLLPLLVPLPADRCRDGGLLAGCQPVGILGNALALRFPVDVQDAAVACLVRPHDGWLRRFQLRVCRVAFETALICEAA